MEVDALADTPDYAAQCAEISRQCEAANQAAMDDHNRNLKALEEEYLRQKRILDDKEAAHKDEVDDVKDQEKVVEEEKMDVEKAKKVVKENAHCPPELSEAEEELSEQEDIPNDSEAAIDNECKAKQAVVKARACVDEFRKAERVLSAEEGEHDSEKSDLKGEESQAAAAGDALPPQEKKVADALAAWEAAKKKDPRAAVDGQKEACQSKKDALLRRADADLKALEDEYERQKRILEGKELDHVEEAEHVEAQKGVVAEEKQDVKDAKATVEESAHCEPKWTAAKENLAREEAIPNATPENVHAECAATKEVLKWQTCMDKLNAAKLVLAKEKDEHSEEKSDLSGEKAEAADAKAALPPQEQKVADALAALEAARKARDGLSKCGGESSAAEAPPPRSGAKTSVTVSAAAAFAAAAVIRV